MRTRFMRSGSAIVAAIVLVVIGWWAGRATLRPAVADHETQVPTVVATVSGATVGRSLSLSATVEQPLVPVAVNGLSGTVTSVDISARVKVGDVLYTVDTVPVRAVQGSLPFYRDLSPGLTGTDVNQLQRALTTLRYLQGPVHGRYDAATGQAVRAWQRALGMSVTGVVRLGEVVSVPRLPAAARLGEQIVKGSRVQGGEQAVLAPTGGLSFALVVSQAQAALIPPDAAVTVTHEKSTWPAVISSSETGTEGTVRLMLSAPNGGRVCAQQCGVLPAQERLSLRTTVIVVPEVTGPAVPLAAVHTSPDGSAYVRMEDGTQREVTVRGSSGGVAVVDGVRNGERVLVLGTPEPGDGQ